jgi:hypothetical protein
MRIWLVFFIYVAVMFAALLAFAWPMVQSQWDWIWSIRRPENSYTILRLWLWKLKLGILVNVRMSRHPKIRICLQLRRI